jgi:hypothetical protein
VSAHRGGRLLSGSAAVLLLLAGCGSSSKSTSTHASTSSSTQASTPTSTQQSTASSTAQPPAPSTTTASGTVTGTSGGVTATLHAGTHRPKVGHAWPISFAVTRGGHAVKAEVRYEYLFAGQVVAHRSRYTFTGRFKDIFTWPSSAVGYPLTFRAVIVSEGATINLDYPVQVTA